MGDMLGNSISGLLSFQRALTTTSHNIANVNTEGYSRQTVDLSTRNPVLIGSSYIGSGVQIDSVARSYDRYLTTSVRDSNSTFYRLERFTALSSEIDNILADPEGGISPLLQEFFTSVQDVSDDPASGTARQQLITTSESLVNRFSTFDSKLDQLTKNVSSDLHDVVDEINQIASSIVDINRALSEQNASGELSGQSSDLLDRRDMLLNELSKKTNINIINENENNITVMVGNGQTLLAGTELFGMSVIPDPADPEQDIIIYNGFSTSNDLSAQLTGGELGGLLDYRENVLEPAVNSVGRIAIVLADTFNDQHREGMDLNDALGGDFFTFSQPSTIAHTTNTGTSTITTTITDATQLTVDDYTLDFDGANWNLVSSSGSSTSVADAGAADTTIIFEGLTVVIAGASVPLTNDTFDIKPTKLGASTIDVAITDLNEIAAAAPIRAFSSLQNLGSTEISQGVVTDATDANLLNTVTLTVESPATTFTSDSIVVTGGNTYAAGASIPYTNNMVIDSNGWQVSLSGTPQPSDTFTIEHNTGGSGDNRNALELSGLQTKSILDNSSNNYQEAYSVLVGRIGSVTHSAEIDRDAQESLLIQAQESRDKVSGVNLDEEAADLIKYQQAYAAAARVITTAHTLFETLINSTR